MTLFFILLIALVVYQFTTRKSLSQIYPQFDRRQIRRLTDAPFYVSGWALLFILVAYALSALTAMIGELFNVDNYIAIFSGGWLGLILQFLRSNGFIGDIQEPMVLLQYKDTISTIYTITIIFGIICGAALVGYCRELKKAQLNKTAILTYNYLSMACGLTSFLLIMWGLYEFNNLLNHAVIFHMEEIYLYFTLLSIGTCGATLFLGRRELKKLFDLPQCESLTWQQVLSKLKINTDKGQKQITEGQIVGIALCLSLLVTGCVVLSTLPVSAEPEPEQYEATYSGGGEEYAAPPVKNSEPEGLNQVVDDRESTFVDDTEGENEILDGEPLPSYTKEESDCILLLSQFYTVAHSIIDVNGGFSAYETRRFIEYTACLIRPLVDLGEDYDIGDGTIKIAEIKPLEGYPNHYIVEYYGDSYGYRIEATTIVVMKQENGKWKIDNAYRRNDEDGQFYPIIDYSKSPEDYYVCPMCGDC